MSGQRYVICESQQYKGCVQLSGWSFWQSVTTLAWAKACYGKEDYALDRRSNPMPLHVCHSLVPPMTLPDGTRGRGSRKGHGAFFPFQMADLSDINNHDYPQLAELGLSLLNLRYS